MLGRTASCPTTYKSAKLRGHEPRKPHQHADSRCIDPKHVAGPKLHQPGDSRACGRHRRLCASLPGHCSPGCTNLYPLDHLERLWPGRYTHLAGVCKELPTRPIDATLHVLTQSRFRQQPSPSSASSLKSNLAGVDMCGTFPLRSTRQPCKPAWPRNWYSICRRASRSCPYSP